MGAEAPWPWWSRLVAQLVHISVHQGTDFRYNAGPERLIFTSWALCIKDLITSPNSTTGWGPGVQTPEPVGDISDLSHNTDVKQTCALKSPPPQSAAGLDLQLRFSEAPLFSVTPSSPTYFLGEFTFCLLFYF